MEARDSVISWERIRMITADNNKHNRRGECRAEEYCKVQAEISFKAGQEEERKRTQAPKEVVEWINTHRGWDSETWDEWQAQLKDWDISNKAGREEVEEWIEKTSKAGQPSKFIPSSEWEAFKKGGV